LLKISIMIFFIVHTNKFFITNNFLSTKILNQRYIIITLVCNIKEKI